MEDGDWEYGKEGRIRGGGVRMRERGRNSAREREGSGKKS